MLFLAAFSLLPVVSSSGYVRRVGFDTVLYMLLALGLNVVVGWGGLLDLGFVAFYGIGAYTYAILDSDKFGLHLPSLVSVPITRRDRCDPRPAPRSAVTTAHGRLPGDRHAVLPGALPDADDERRQRVRAQPDRRPERHPATSIRSASSGTSWRSQHEGVFAVSYLYVALAFFAVVFVALRFVNDSRTGRAWRSLREDSLAAEAMGMPVDWLKLMSFAIRRGGRRPDRDAVRGAQRERVPAHLLFRPADHRLHDGHPGRRGKPGRGRAGRRDHQPAARDAARPRQGAHHLLRRAGRRSGVRVQAPDARVRHGCHDRLRLRGARARASDRLLVGGRREGQRARVRSSTIGSSRPSISPAGWRPSRTSA